MDEFVPLPLTQRLNPRQWLALDVLFAALLFSATAAAITRREPGLPSGAGWDGVRLAFAALTTAALPLRRRHPMLVLGIITFSVAVLIWLGGHGPAQTAVAFATFSAAAASPRRLPPAIGGAVVALVLAAALAAPDGPQWGSVIAGPAVVLAGWLAGENTRTRRAFARSIVERAQAREREREERMRQAAVDERVRIARELHDVVAHAMSVIAVRSGAARMVIDTDPDEARETLRIVETTSRRALREMRRLVGVLRQPDEAGPRLDPAPGLSDLEELVRQIDQTGTRVELRVEGEPRPLPEGVELSAYRIAQEALTNVVRHAGSAHAQLRVRYGADEVEIEVTDEGGRAALGATAPEPNGAGHGLIGMRERVALYGGELEAGPTGAGFRVMARLPTDEHR